MQNVSKTASNRALISAIFTQAMQDILLYPNAHIYFPYPKNSSAYNAVDAMRFVNKDNKAFRFYCRLLGLDPSYMVRKMYQEVGFIINQKKDRKKIKKQRGQDVLYCV